jgi:hypothetical protein
MLEDRSKSVDAGKLRRLTVDGRADGVVLPVPYVVPVAVLLLSLDLTVLEPENVAVAPVGD